MRFIVRIISWYQFDNIISIYILVYQLVWFFLLITRYWVSIRVIITIKPFSWWSNRSQWVCRQCPDSPEAIVNWTLHAWQLHNQNNMEVCIFSHKRCCVDYLNWIHVKNIFICLNFLCHECQLLWLMSIDFFLFFRFLILKNE